MFFLKFVNKTFIFTLGFLALFLVLQQPLHAKSTYLNGVNIDGMTNQTFKNCTVNIDANGDIYISAPQYRVEKEDQPTEIGQEYIPVTNSESSKLKKKYWLVSLKNRPGSTQYSIDIYINEVWMRKITSDDNQVIMDVTKYLNPGKNKISFTANKATENGRKSTNPTDIFKILIGEGKLKDQSVVLESQLVKYSRNASETDNFQDSFEIKAN